MPRKPTVINNKTEILELIERMSNVWKRPSKATSYSDQSNCLSGLEFARPGIFKLPEELYLNELVTRNGGKMSLHFEINIDYAVLLGIGEEFPRENVLAVWGAYPPKKPVVINQHGLLLLISNLRSRNASGV